LWASINVHRVGHVINYWRRRHQRHRRRWCRKALISLRQPVIGIRDLLRDIRHFHNIHRKVIGIGPFMCVRKLEWLRPSVCDLFKQKFRRVKFERGNYSTCIILCTCTSTLSTVYTDTELLFNGILKNKLRKQNESYNV